MLVSRFSRRIGGSFYAPVRQNEFLRNWWMRGCTCAVFHRDGCRNENGTENALCELFDVYDYRDYCYPAVVLLEVGLYCTGPQTSMDLAVLLWLPVILTLAAATARSYPFSDRLVLFLAASVTLTMADGLEVFLSRVDRRLAWACICLHADAADVLDRTFPALRTIPGGDPTAHAAFASQYPLRRSDLLYMARFNSPRPLQTVLRGHGPSHT